MAQLTPSYTDCRSSRLELNLIKAVSSEDRPPNNVMIFEKRPKLSHLVTIPRGEIKQIHLQQLTISYRLRCPGRSSLQKKSID